MIKYFCDICGKESELKNIEILGVNKEICETCYNSIDLQEIEKKELQIKENEKENRLQEVQNYVETIIINNIKIEDETKDETKEVI